MYYYIIIIHYNVMRSGGRISDAFKCTYYIVKLIKRFSRDLTVTRCLICILFSKTK